MTDNCYEIKYSYLSFLVHFQFIFIIYEEKKSCNIIFCYIEALYILPEERTGGQIWLACMSLYIVLIFHIMYIFSISYLFSTLFSIFCFAWLLNWERTEKIGQSQTCIQIVASCNTMWSIIGFKPDEIFTWRGMLIEIVSNE